jgi:(1->4)-alpha-D-glucan 1-alpha-D-glucosylmutase
MQLPTATYRLQLHPALGFRGARDLVDYLAELGVTACYTSPVFAAAPGSTHGYDVVDHSRLDPALGTEDDFVAFATRLRERGLGLVLDIVPNHMCISSVQNLWWSDVLENGPSSSYARYFDIDWEPPKADLKGKVLLPILGDQFGRVLERGEISIRFEDDTFVAAYYDARLPIAPRSWPHLLEPVLADLRRALGEADPNVLEVESILTALAHLPLRTETARARTRERRREKEIARRRLVSLLADCPQARPALDRSIASFNVDHADPASVDRLELLLSEQGYRPSYWRVASDEINYRRFFDINELAAIRVEEPAVLRAVHAIPLALVRQRLVTGLRIDHVDGLLAPRRYLQDLQHALRQATGVADSEPPGCYVVVEKILAPGERLPRDWPVHGTTGYEVTALLTGLLLEPAGVHAIEDVHAAFTGAKLRRDDVEYESKKLVIRSAMSSELTVLARKLDDISEQHRASRDFTLNSLQEALGELVACFPVYRTYVAADDAEVGAADREHIERAIALAKRRNPATSASIYDFLRDLLLLQDPGGIDEAQRDARRDFVLRFQQLTSPVMAKGLEDTVFYRHSPLAALDEVGGGHGGAVPIEAFHADCARRAIDAPFGMSTTATHDTKRGEDVRARLCVLSEVPGVWQRALAALARHANAHKPRPDVPDANEEYLLYQTLVGAWPPGLTTPDAAFRARIQRYVTKALREAKVHTSWINPDDGYERDVQTFVAAVLDPAASPHFLGELAAVRAAVERAGYWNALAQLVLKIGMPGVPDFYQGTELWDGTLVDPDNRRPVDFAVRARLLAELRQAAELDLPGLVDRLRGEIADGRLKLLITTRALRLRRAYPGVFAGGGYQPLATRGAHRDRVVAFARTDAGHRVIVACGRHFVGLVPPPRDPLGACWGDTVLELGPAGTRYRDALTDHTAIAGADGTLAVRDVFVHLPVALLAEVP